MRDHVWGVATTCVACMLHMVDMDASPHAHTPSRAPDMSIMHDVQLCSTLSAQPLDTVACMRVSTAATAIACMHGMLQCLLLARRGGHPIPSFKQQGAAMTGRHRRSGWFR